LGTAGENKKINENIPAKKKNLKKSKRIDFIIKNELSLIAGC
jgi:hypothetical protein